MKIQTKKLSLFVESIGRVTYGVVIVLLLAVGGLIAVSGMNLPGNYKLYVVQSGSMEPTIHMGSLIATKPQNSYSKGDIITVRDTANSTLTHRIAEIRVAGGQTYFVTKGDANKAPDLVQKLSKDIVGKEYVAVPYIGYVLNFAKTKNGMLFFIIFPSIIIIYNELLTIKDEALKLIHKRKKLMTISQKSYAH